MRLGSLPAALAALSVAVSATPARAASAAAADPEREALLSAALVYNIARFSTWPDAAVADGSFDVCIDRRGATADAFATIAGKPVAGVPVRITMMRPDERQACDVAYFSRARGYDEDLASRQKVGTLTIGRSGDFLTSGGAVRLTIEGRPRFAVDVRAARGAGVRPSAKLLSLAEEVVK